VLWMYCMQDMIDQSALIARTVNRMDVKGLFFMSFRLLYGFPPGVVQLVFLPETHLILPLESANLAAP